MKKQKDKLYYVVLVRTPILTPEVENGKRNKDKIMATTVMGIYRTLKTANKWSRIYKNNLINIFDKAYKFNWWRQEISAVGTENYVLNFKKSKQLFQVNVVESKIQGPPPKDEYELNLYLDDELDDQEKIEDIEKYLQEQAQEIKEFEGEE